ncbi:MAG: hypothetical protein IJL73_01785 [Lachnospiraceae bacterium]|nr:hypothetical protein [Lachnospiraceae bacterium]
MSDNGLEKVSRFLLKDPVLIAGTTGFDKKPKLHKAELCYEADGTFYFAVPKCESFYGELSLCPVLTLGAYDREEKTFLRIQGQAVFTEEKDVIDRCLQASSSLREKWGEEPGMLIAFFLKDVTLELVRDDGTSETIELGTPENVLVGITMKKDKEIRDRLTRIMERREAEKPELLDEASIRRQKICDGTLLLLAEKAKELWPRLDIQPAERSVIFETWDEREEYTRLARKRLGNTRIDKPEDLTYWLSVSE